MMQRKYILILICLLVASGCSGLPPAQIGQVAGALIGTAVAPGIGAPIGHVIGTLAGVFVQDKIDKETETKERVALGQELNQGPQGSVSTAAAPTGATPLGTPQRVWVDESLQGGTVVAGHFEHRYVP